LNLFVFTRKIALPNFLKKDIILTALITLLAFSLFCQENIVWGIKDINKMAASRGKFKRGPLEVRIQALPEACA